MFKNTVTAILLSSLLVSCSSNKKSDMVLKPAARKEDPLKGVQNTSVVYFAFDSFKLANSSKKILDKEIAFSKQGNHYILVEGHCDKVGTEEYNNSLGLKRAKEVKAYLIAGGVPGNCIKEISFGKSLPIDKLNAKNRRGVLVYQGGVCSN